MYIHEPEVSHDLDVQSLLPEDVYCRRVELRKEAQPQEPFISSADLVIAYARINIRETIELWRGISTRFLNKTWLAILPKGTQGEHLKNISEFVDDFVLWPSEPAEVAHRIRLLLKKSGGAASTTVLKLLHEIGFAQLVGEDPVFLRALEMIPALALSAAPVLITGETGTGKEFSARAIHFLGAQKHRAFVPVDCGAIPDQVFENEMFGHFRGGYTDAHADQKGLAETADGGTLFLDEINSLSMTAQAKLLRFLQEGTIKPLGGSKFIKVNARIISATNQDLAACVQKGQFRADLFYRLNVLRLALPPLRLRPLDIPLLAQHFLNGLGASRTGKRRWFSAGALRKLGAYSWPGNVRELYNVVQQTSVLADSPPILPEHIPLPEPAAPQALSGFHAEREHAIAAFERTYIEQLLLNCGGNVTEAAKLANQNRRSIGRLIKKYQIDRKALAVAS